MNVNDECIYFKIPNDLDVNFFVAVSEHAISLHTLFYYKVTNPMLFVQLFAKKKPMIQVGSMR